MSSPVHTGNAGEHLVMAELLYRGFSAGLADRGNPSFDIIARKDECYSSVRVKTSRSRTFQWSARAPYDPLPGFRREDGSDITVLVALGGSAPRAAELYVIPTAVVVDALNGTYRHYHSFSRRDGQPRKESTQRLLRLDGEDRHDNTSYGFAQKWRRFREAWHLLEHNRREGDAREGPTRSALIGQICERMLQDPALTYADILGAVRRRVPHAQTTERCLSWYGTQLRKQGLEIASKAEREARLV